MFLHNMHRANTCHAYICYRENLRKKNCNAVSWTLFHVYFMFISYTHITATIYTDARWSPTAQYLNCIVNTSYQGFEQYRNYVLRRERTPVIKYEKRELRTINTRRVLLLQPYYVIISIAAVCFVSIASRYVSAQLLLLLLDPRSINSPAVSVNHRQSVCKQTGISTTALQCI